MRSIEHADRVREILAACGERSSPGANAAFAHALLAIAEAIRELPEQPSRGWWRTSKGELRRNDEARLCEVRTADGWQRMEEGR